MPQREYKEYIESLGPEETVTVNKRGLMTFVYGMLRDHMEADKMYCHLGTALFRLRHNRDFADCTREGINSIIK